MANFSPDDKIAVVRTHGGQHQEFISISELNELIDANDHVVEVDLSGETLDYDIQAADTVVIATATAEADSTVTLPLSTGSYKRLTIKNLGANSLTVNLSASDTLDGSNDPSTITTLSSLTVFDCAAGKWIII